MNLFELDRNWNLVVDPIAWGYEPFNKILKRDKSRQKEIAVKEMLFVYSFADIKSDYLSIVNEEERTQQLILDLKLDKDWKRDNVIDDAIRFYKERSTTVIQALYESARSAALEIGEYLKDTKKLLDERTEKGSAVTNVNIIVGALAKVPSIMRNLSEAHKELVKEQKSTEGRMKGSKELSMFEDGLDV